MVWRDMCMFILKYVYVNIYVYVFIGNYFYELFFGGYYIC